MADLDVITLAEAKVALHLNTSGVGDPEIQGYVTAISQRMDRLVGPIVQREVEDEVHDGGLNFISTRYRPIASVDSLVERSGGSEVTLDPEVFPGNGYSVRSASGLIYRRSGGADYRFAPGRGNIVVSYVAGRFEDTASVDQRFKLAATIILAHLWRREQGIAGGPFLEDGTQALTVGFAIPHAARDLIADEILGPLVA